MRLNQKSCPSCRYCQRREWEVLCAADGDDIPAVPVTATYLCRLIRSEIACELFRLPHWSKLYPERYEAMKAAAREKKLVSAKRQVRLQRAGNRRDAAI